MSYLYRDTMPGTEMTGLETTLLGAAAKEAVGPAKNFVAKWGMPKYERLVVEYSRCFDAHLIASRERCSMIKNILYRDERVTLLSQYTNVCFLSIKGEILDTDLLSGKLRSERFIISGTAGAGKTMFMKWLTLDALDTIHLHQRIPLYVELRYLTTEEAAKDFIKFLLESTSEAENRVTISRFKTGLELGQFIIVLDAIDEVSKGIRATVLSQIQNFSRSYPKCTIVLSTRPDESVEALQDFRVYRTVDMTQDQIVSVISRLEFDETVKSRLVRELNAGLFNKHKEFLSNPLLATIMLLTYDQSAEIPTKLTAFYKQAFEALYQRHDAAKGAYRRGHHAGLPLDEYEKIFSVFCYDSYVDGKLQFDDAELLNYFDVARDYYQLSAKPVDLVLDSKESVCVIQRDGLFNTFAHRSFQEYFTALFLSRYTGDDFSTLVDGIVVAGVGENVLRMLLELSPELLEEKWVQQRLKPLVVILSSADVSTQEGCEDIFSALFSSLDIATETGEIDGFGNSFGVSPHQAGTWLPRLERAYSPRKALATAIFEHEETGPVFTSLQEYYANLEEPNVSLDSLHSRLHLDSDEMGDRPRLSVEVSDVEWLMQSNLPRILNYVSQTIIRYSTDVTDRIAHRQRSMSHLSKRRGRGPRVMASQAE